MSAAAVQSMLECPGTVLEQQDGGPLRVAHQVISLTRPHCLSLLKSQVVRAGQGGWADGVKRKRECVSNLHGTMGAKGGRRCAPHRSVRPPRPEVALLRG